MDVVRIIQLLTCPVSNSIFTQQWQMLKAPPEAILTKYEWKFVNMLILGRNKFFNWKLSKDICTRKEKLLLDSEKFLFSWWELVSGIRYFPPLQTQAQIMTTNMMGPRIVRDVYHMCREANVNSYHMCIQRSRPATTPVSKIHYAKKGKWFTAIILQFSKNIYI